MKLYNTLTHDVQDFAPADGKLSFQDSLSVSNGTSDTKVELDETFDLILSGVVDGGRSVTASAVAGTGTILNDDTAQFTVSSESGNEDDGPITFGHALQSGGCGHQRGCLHQRRYGPAK